MSWLWRLAIAVPMVAGTFGTLATGAGWFVIVGTTVGVVVTWGYDTISSPAARAAARPRHALRSVTDQEPAGGVREWLDGAAERTVPTMPPVRSRPAGRRGDRRGRGDGRQSGTHPPVRVRQRQRIGRLIV